MGHKKELGKHEAATALSVAMVLPPNGTKAFQVTPDGKGHYDVWQVMHVGGGVWDTKRVVEGTMLLEARAAVHRLSVAAQIEQVSK